MAERFRQRSPLGSILIGFRDSFSLLDARGKRRYLIVVGIQSSTAFLDLMGVALIGVLSLRMLDSGSPTQGATSALLGPVWAAPLGVLAAIACVFLLAKSVASVLMLRLVFRFLGNRQAEVSEQLASRLLSGQLLTTRYFSTQQIAYGLSSGANAATVVVLGEASVLFSEIALLVVLGILLFVVDPAVALGALVFFALLALALNRSLAGWASRIGKARARLDVESMAAVQESVHSFREIYALNRVDNYLSRIGRLRREAARVAAGSSLITGIPKYVFEAATVVGGVGLAVIVFLQQDSARSLAVIAIFIVAATRITPSILRVQNSTLSIRNNAGVAFPTYELNRLLPPLDPEQRLAEKLSIARLGDLKEFDSSVAVSNVTFTYPGSLKPAIQDITMSAAKGEAIALVGPSGSGKSTLLDCIIGLLQPDSGTVLVGQSPAKLAPTVWPGHIACVPQHVTLANSSIRHNVGLGLEGAEIDDSAVWEALERAHLADFVASLPEKLDAFVGEQGVRLSGGQRQRLGIARALYSRPGLLLLDEATSALDAQTEAIITSAVHSLRGKTTTITIAHRLPTIAEADRIYVLDAGVIVASGTFDHLLATSEEFARQASLLGIERSREPIGGRTRLSK